MKKKFAIISTAALLALGWILGTGGSAFAAPALAPYTLAAWKLGPATKPNDLVAADITNAFADQQKLVGQLGQTTLDLNGLDSTLSPGCYQIDGYNTNDTTTALLAGGVLNAPNNPAESLAYGAPGLVGNPYKYICVLPTETWPTASSTCDSYTLPALDANGKYMLNTDGSRPIAGTFPLTPGQVAGPFVAHTLASSVIVQSSVTFGPFTGVACPTATPTPIPTPPTTIEKCGAGLACTGVPISPGEGFLGVGLALTGVGALMYSYRRRGAHVAQ